MVVIVQARMQKSKEDSKEDQIKKSFAKTLDMYPIKNLEDLYDKEGYRDGEFEKVIRDVDDIYRFCQK